MLKSIKKIGITVLIIFLFISTLLLISAIWNFVEMEIIKDIFIKTAYTLGVIFLVSGIVSALMDSSSKKK